MSADILLRHFVALRQRIVADEAVGSGNLTAGKLQTVLVGVEAVLNSRSLGATSQDPSDSATLYFQESSLKVGEAWLKSD